MSAKQRTLRARNLALTTVGAGALTGMLILSSLEPRLAVVFAAATLTLIAASCRGLENTGSAVLVLALFTAPLTTLRPTGAVPFITVSDVLLGIGFLLVLPQLVHTRPRIPTQFTVGAWLLTVASLVPVLLSPAPLDNLGYLARVVAAVILLPLAFGYWHPDLRTIRTLAWAYVAGTLAGWIVGIVTSTGDGSREQGLTTHPNFLALTGQTAITLLIFLFLTAPPSRRWIVGVSAVLSLLAVVSSGSRSGLIAVAFTALVYPFANRSPRAAYLTIAAGVMATLVSGRVLASADEGSALRRLFVGTSSTTGSDRQREMALGRGWSEFISHPLTGVGFDDRTLETHNIYLQVAQGAGVFGLVGFLLILWAVVRPLLTPGPLAALGYTALGYVLIGLFQPSLWDRLIWVAVALAAVAATRYKPELDPTEVYEDTSAVAQLSLSRAGPLPGPTRS